MESESGDIGLPSLVKSLKRQISYIQIEPHDEAAEHAPDASATNNNTIKNNLARKNSDISSKIPTKTKSQDSTNGGLDCIDTTNTSVYNAEGVLVRKSKYNNTF